MAAFTAADVKTLRDRLGAGMLDSKNALVEAGGDIEKAIEILRVKGLKGVEKRSGRATTAGLVTAIASSGSATLIELAARETTAEALRAVRAEVHGGRSRATGDDAIRVLRELRDGS